MSRFYRSLISLTVLSSLGFGQTHLTVYNHGQALVKESFSRKLAAGESHIEIEDVAEAINPASVKLSSGNALQVLEQNYRYDLVDQNKLLKKYLGAAVTVVMQNDKKVNGELLSYDNQTLVLESKTGTDIIQRNFVGSIKCPMPAERLYIKPTLEWTVQTAKAGPYDLELSYLTGGVSWRAEYVATISENDKEMELSSWINLNNTSGKAYKDTKLKLVAGDLHRASQSLPRAAQEKMMFAMDRGAVVEERGFFEYHLYEIGFPVSVNNREEKQIQWLNPSPIKTEKRYVFENGNADFSNIPVKISFKNDKTSGVGIALPEGIVRLFKKDADGALELMGEDQLQHTSKDDLVSFELGKAFDVKGKREVLDRRSKQSKFYDEDIRITLANRKDEAVEIDVIQQVGYGNWKIIDASEKFEKLDASRVKFVVPVAANSEIVLSYTVHVSLK